MRVKTVLPEQYEQFCREVKKLGGCQDYCERLIKMSELGKCYLTALDKKEDLAELLPLELFVEGYFEETDWIADQLDLRKLDGRAPQRA